MTDAPTTAASGARPSYEAARAELVDVVQKLESGRVPLAESMALWERGEELAAICQQWLDGARAKVEQARERAAGTSGAAQDQDGARQQGQPEQRPDRSSTRDDDEAPSEW